MEKRIRDAFGQEYLLVETPPGAPGTAHGGFSDEQSAQQFLQRFAGSPRAMSTLREALADEAQPANRMPPSVQLASLAGRLVTRGLRLVLPGRSGSGQASSVKESSAAAAQPAKPEPKEAVEEVTAKKKTLVARWSHAEAYCADQVQLLGSATNMGAGTAAAGQGSVPKAGTVASLQGRGQNSFNLPWTVKDVVFPGPQAPPKKDVQGKLSAGGLTAMAPQPLAVKRVPDSQAKPVSFKLTSGKYGWTAAFRLAISGRKLLVQQTLQITPAWLGKWVSFDAEADGRSGWGFVKKDAATWMFYDSSATPPAWTALPRGISKYTVNNMVFIKSGDAFVARDQPDFKWPEVFATPVDYVQKKAAWLANIHQVWDDKFNLKHKGCKSSSSGCCTWRIRVSVQWSDSAGDKAIYAVAAQEWERSNAKDWYLSEHRIGVAAHECGHLLGAYDEYEGGAVDPATNIIVKNSVMGSDLATPFARHLDGLRDQAKGLINPAIGRSWAFEVK